jgi:hypothetical protein
VAEDRADEYRRKAEVCRQEAGKSPYETDKAAWLRMAEDWLRLAASADSAKDKAQKPTNPK